MKINYLRTFKADGRVSMDNYAKDMIKFYAKVCDISFLLL